MGEHHSVAAAVLVRRARVLLCHRHPDRRWYPDVWDVPGGHIDDGESPAQALHRELLEELGVTVRVDSPEPFRTYQPTDDLTLYAWVVTEWDGEIANVAPDEHDEIAWFSLDEVADLDLADDALRDLLAAAVASEVDAVPMLRRIDPARSGFAARIVEIQRAAYAVEAELIGFDGIPQLNETEQAVRELVDLSWMGAFAGEVLVGLIAWDQTEEVVDIDRLAVDPAYARRGFGRRLVRSVPSNRPVVVSTGEANRPAVDLYLAEGFEHTGSIEIAPDVRVAQFRRSS